MAKKVVLSFAAVAVVAVALPALANADKLTLPAGKLAPVGTAVTMMSANMTVATSAGVIKCTKAEKKAAVKENNGAEFEIGGVAPEGTTEDCTIGAKAAPITDITVFAMTGNAVGTALNLTFKATLPGGVACHFTSVNVPFTYPGGTNVFTVTNGKLTATPAACAPGTLNASFTLTETAGGAQVILD